MLSHAKALENTLNIIDCKTALSDKFANTSLLEKSLLEKGKKIKLFQKKKAESNIAVAAASILARDAFIVTLDTMEKTFKTQFPKGCSKTTKKQAKNFVKRFGKEKI